MTENVTEKVEPQDEEQVEAGGISQWEFIGVPPTREDVIRLLNTLDPVWGVESVDFADYVQALPQKKKIKKPHPTNPSITIDEYVESWTLYMGVAGRMKMLENAARENNWRVDFEPEPTTPVGIPGLLQHGDGRIVYREYVKVYEVGTDGERREFGSKSGTAWVPYSGGSQAAGSNPYEKVETSARGRALAAWGFGVFPGSGIASVEEMQAAQQNQRVMDRQERGNGGGNGGDRRRRPSREELQGRVLQSMEEFRQRLGSDEATFTQQIVTYLTGIGAKDVYSPDTGQILWENVTDGHLQLLGNKIAEHLKDLVSQEFGGPQ